MPSRAVLEAIPKAFRLAEEPAEVIVTSLLALLCSAPDRINEVLLLPVDCEVDQPGREGNSHSYGLRWWPAKGADPMVKWIINSMSGVAKEAVAKLRTCTEEAREIARWYEGHPNQIYLPKDLNHLRTKQFLTMKELDTLLFIRDGEAPRHNPPKQWCDSKSIRTFKDSNGKLIAPFNEVEKAVLAMLPPGFPFLNKALGLKYSDALLVIRHNELHATRATYKCVIEGVTVDKCNERLGTGSQYGKQSIFERLRLTSSDGAPLQVTTHQFRHYLNTLAQAKYVSDIDIALWSGRKDINQNAAYDHTTPEERLALMREAVGDSSSMLGPLAEVPKYVPIRRDEFARLVIPTAHTTDFGFCIHDYAMSPCSLHLDCINCPEQVCVKGDSVKTEFVRSRLEEGRLLLSMAEDATKDGYAGADRWMDHHKITVERLSQLYELLSNPTVADGAFIQLSIPKIASALQLAADDRAIVNGSGDMQNDDDLALMREFMIGMEAD